MLLKFQEQMKLHTLIIVLLAGNLLSPGLASAESWILWEESEGATRNIQRSAVHGFESRRLCVTAANELMGAIASKDGYELAVDPFDHETIMGRRGRKPDQEFKYALCYPSHFDPRDRSKEETEH